MSDYQVSTSTVPGAVVPDADIVVYPLAMEGDIGVYSESVLTLVKEWRVEGVDVQYLHDANHRTWLGLNGAVIFTIVVGLFTSGAVATLQTLLTSKLQKVKVRLKAGRRIGADGSSEEWIEAEGTGSELAAVLEVWMEGGVDGDGAAQG
jgi:hypothetical protein